MEMSRTSTECEPGAEVILAVTSTRIRGWARLCMFDQGVIPLALCLARSGVGEGKTTAGNPAQLDPLSIFKILRFAPEPTHL